MGKQVARQKPQTLRSARGFLTRDDVMQQIQASVAKTVDPDRLVRVALTAMSRNPSLLECSQASWVLALQEAGSLGLEPTGVLGHAYLVPRYNKNTRSMEAQFQIGYRGLVELSRRSGRIQDVSAHVVRDGDDFVYALGIEPTLKHVPLLDSDRDVTHVYAVAFFKDGFKKFDVMTTEQVEKVRKTSSAADRGPWVSHWEEMAKKTVVRRLSKELPLSATEQAVIAYDDEVEYGSTGGRVDLNRFIAGDADDIPEPEPDAERAADRTRERIKQISERMSQDDEIVQEAEFDIEGETEPNTSFEDARRDYESAWNTVTAYCKENGIEQPDRPAWQDEHIGKRNSGHFSEEELNKATTMLKSNIGIDYSKITVSEDDLPF